MDLKTYVSLNLPSCAIGDGTEHGTRYGFVGFENASTLCRRGANKKDGYTSRFDGSGASYEIKTNRFRVADVVGNKFLIYGLILPTEIDKPLNELLFVLDAKQFLIDMRSMDMTGIKNGVEFIKPLFDVNKGNGNPYIYYRKGYSTMIEYIETNYLEEPTSIVRSLVSGSAYEWYLKSKDFKHQ